GFEVLAHQGGETPPFARLKEVLEAGGVVALLAERDLTRTGVTVDFFGEEANMAAGPARLAQETGASLHAVDAWFDDDTWGLALGPEIEVDNVQDTTQRMADQFAANIAKHPQDWHMLQPQWNADIAKRRRKR
ncbi:MAG: phosphatidylinositol mannoside acyltransferase, partial [Corynebacterium camporealensis]|nr:phosphatidylinositol mannoside acyltransferase [Corynebacterium camporealensis]